MTVWGALMVVAGGLFAGGSATFAWSRVSIWRTMPPPAFVDDFAQTIQGTDKVQPDLLVIAIAAEAEGTHRAVATCFIASEPQALSLTACRRGKG
jgi:hypothetical protein